jgi:hypothetical protein
MIFNRTYRLSSNKTTNDLKQHLNGQHIQIHGYDFETIQKENIIKIIPHAENTNKVTTLPISNLSFVQKSNKTFIKMETHPRRIDVGGPYILLLLTSAIFFVGFLMGLYGGTEQSNSSKMMMGIGLAIFILFWIKMEIGYFDYVRKLKKWVVEKL